MQGSSKELQEITISALMKYPHLLSKCSTEITESFFESKHYRLIYKCLKDYYQKYLSIPSQKELIILIRDNHSEDYGNLDEIFKSFEYVSNLEVESEEFVFEKVVEFIRRCKVEGALGRVLQFYENGKIDLDEVAVDLQNSISLNFTKNSAINLADVSNVSKVRKDALGDVHNPTIVKFFLDDVNYAFQYKGLIAGTLNAVSAPPGRGKTTMLINQGVSMAQQGYKVLHVFLGDMSTYDGLLRYLSCLSGKPTSMLIDLEDDELVSFIKKFNMSGHLSNVDIVSYAADELTTNQLIDEITTMQKNNHVHYDSIIVDYDENLADETDNMYTSGGQIYNKLALFSVMNKSVIFIASQPKTEYWKQEVLPLESLSESSKKQKIVDLIITLGKPGKSSSIGTLYLAKNRRGEDSKLYRIKINGATCRMEHITEEEYNNIKQSERN